MSLQCPYNKTDLLLAINNINNKFYEKADEIGDILGEWCIKYGMSNKNTQLDLNKIIAKNNGISVSELINSPNMDFLVKQHHDNFVSDLIQKLKNDFNFTDKEAWSIIMNDYL